MKKIKEDAEEEGKRRRTERMSDKQSLFEGRTWRGGGRQPSEFEPGFVSGMGRLVGGGGLKWGCWGD